MNNHSRGNGSRRRGRQTRQPSPLEDAFQDLSLTSPDDEPQWTNSGSHHVPYLNTSPVNTGYGSQPPQFPSPYNNTMQPQNFPNYQYGSSQLGSFYQSAVEQSYAPQQPSNFQYDYQAQQYPGQYVMQARPFVQQEWVFTSPPQIRYPIQPQPVTQLQNERQLQYPVPQPHNQVSRPQGSALVGSAAPFVPAAMTPWQAPSRPQTVFSPDQAPSLPIARRQSAEVSLYPLTSMSQRMQEDPFLFKVYYLPGNIHPSSIIHLINKGRGFFNHPVLVVDHEMDTGICSFYSLTSFPPVAIRDHNMFFRLAEAFEESSTENDTEDDVEEPNEEDEEDSAQVLKLARGSHAMGRRTYVNLDRRFRIESQHLSSWEPTVTVDLSEMDKFNEKISSLEATQNRYIYKPLPRDLSWVQPGTILMLNGEEKQQRKNDGRNQRNISPPVLVLEVQRSAIRYLRIKEVKGRTNLGYPTMLDGKPSKKKYRNLMKIGRVGEKNPGGSPVLYLDEHCQDMRVPSLVEGESKQNWASMSRFQTWTYPFMTIQSGSMKKMKQHIAYIESLNLDQEASSSTTDTASAS